MIKVYVSSPYTKGNKEENVEVQIACASLLIDLGFIPFIPLLYHYIDIIYPKSYETWIKIGLVWVKYCDCFLRLPGESKGADDEVQRAVELNMPLFYSIYKLKKYYKIK